MHPYFESFIQAIILGAGFRIGWGIIGLIIDMCARAIGQTPSQSPIK